MMTGEIIIGGNGHHRLLKKEEITGKRDAILERGMIAEREVITVMAGRIDASLNLPLNLHHPLHPMIKEGRSIKSIITIRDVIHHPLIEVQVWTVDDLN